MKRLNDSLSRAKTQYGVAYSSANLVPGKYDTFERVIAEYIVFIVDYISRSRRVTRGNRFANIATRYVALLNMCQKSDADLDDQFQEACYLALEQSYNFIRSAYSKSIHDVYPSRQTWYMFTQTATQFYTALTGDHNRGQMLGDEWIVLHVHILNTIHSIKRSGIESEVYYNNAASLLNKGRLVGTLLDENL